MSYVFGIDVGGTAIKSGLFTDEGRLIAKRSAPTPALVDEQAYGVVLDVMAEMLCEANIDAADVVGIGLDTPGSVLSDGTHAMHHNIDIDIAGLRAAIEHTYPSCPTAVLNDGNAAALGELWQGSAQGAKNFVLYVLGTGVGAGVVIDGHVLAGAHGAAGECGHICVDSTETRACTCGNIGCAEQYGSATWIQRNYLEACEAAGDTPVDVSRGAIAVFQAEKDGDAHAKEAIDLMCDHLGRDLATVACVVDPEVFVMGGGVSAGFDDFSVRLGEAYRRYAIENTRTTPIVAASLGNDAGMYGAAYESLRAHIISQ